MPNISILILTLNEEQNLPGCLESVKWSDDVVVFDSFSTDRTVEIARAAGARVFQRRFDNYANQRNASIKEVQFKHPWVFVLDADECIPQELKEELERTVSCVSRDITIYRVRRQDMFFGRWLRRSSGYPTWFPRLLRPDRVWVEREINEEYHTDGQIGMLRGHFIHHPVSKGVAFWFDRHNRYSTMEAEALFREMRKRMRWFGVFSRDPVIRRRNLKQLAFRLPYRPLLVFIYLYFVRFGFLDGTPGYHFCRLRMTYEYMIDLKVKELRRRGNGMPV